MRWKIIGGLQTVFGTRKMLVTKSLCYDEENGKQEGMEFFVQLHGPTSNLELDLFFFFFQAEDGIRDLTVTGDQTCALPISAYAGVQDAMVQWWYGHNAVGFFLTAGFLGMMYYFIPKQANRPVYSYRLSVVHFWALIFTYMWAGPHHLHYTALPDWAQSLGMAFSLILLAPSWGGMINGIMTLSGAWHKLRTDPILKFLVVSLSFYGMATFEGPMMSIKTVNALSHYTDWTVGHVH